MFKNSGLHTMLRLSRFVKPFRGRILAAVLLGVLGNLCAMMIPFAASMLVIGYIQQDPSVIWWWVLIASGLLRGPLRYGEQALNHDIAFKLLAKIRDEVFAALRKLAPAKMETRDRGNLVSLITNDVELLEVFYAHTLSPVLIAFFVSIIVILIQMKLVGNMALMTVVALLLIGFVFPIVASHAGLRTGLQVRNNIGELNSRTLEVIRGLSDLDQYNALSDAVTLTDNLTQQVNRDRLVLAHNKGFVRGLVDVTIVASMLVYGLLLINEPLTNVIPALVLHLSCFGPVIALSNLSGDLHHTLASGKRVCDLLDETPPIEFGKATLNQVVTELKLENISFGYGTDKNLLDDVSLHLKTPVLVGIKGESGVGKSTLIKLILRYWDPQKGEILCNDQPIHTLSEAALRKMCSVMMQDTDLFQGTIYDNIALVKPDCSSEAVFEACRKASLHEFICDLPEGYETNVTEQGHNFSSGEKQRIGLARMFLHDAPIFILDEPTSNVDSLNESVILNALEQYKDQKIIILISHRKSTLSIADTVYELKNGKLVLATSDN